MKIWPWSAQQRLISLPSYFLETGTGNFEKAHAAARRSYFFYLDWLWLECLYGLLKKMAPLSALHGLLVEAGCMFIPSMVYLTIVHANGAGVFASMDTKTDLLLVGAGIITAIPLFMFSVAAQRLPFSILGITQYLAPRLAFLLGVFLYHEPFNESRLLGFAAVWLALGLFVFDGQDKKKTSPQH